MSREIQKHSVNGEYDAKKAKQKSLAERWRAKEQCLKVAMSGFSLRFCRRKTGKEVVSKTNQWIFKKRIWNRLLLARPYTSSPNQRIRISPVLGLEQYESMQEEIQMENTKGWKEIY